VTFLGNEGGTGAVVATELPLDGGPKMEKNKTALTGKALRKPSLIAALLLTALSLSACVVPVDRDSGGDGHRRHHWNNDGDWNGGAGWQGNGGDWNHHR
jgi:hypothetical protein